MKNNKKFDKNDFFISVIFIVIALVLIGISLYKIIKTKDFDSANIETTILFFISIIYAIYKIVNDKKSLSIFVKEDVIKTTKNTRIKKYLKESLIFSIVIVCLDLLSIWFLEEKDAMFVFKGLSDTLNIVVNSLITFIIAMLVSYGFEYLVGELYVKKEKIKK